MQQPQECVLSDALRGGDPCARISLAQDTLQEFGQLRFRALGSSMLPAVAPGDVLTFVKAVPSDVAIGQIVLMRRVSGLVAHRLIHIDRDMLVTMGDSMPSPDEPMDSSMLLGVLAAQHRDCRFIPTQPDHRRLLPSASRWAMRHIPLVHRIARRWPRLAALTA